MINFNSLLGLFNFSKNVKMILVGIAVLLVVIACIKFKNGRIFVFTFLGTALIAFTIYAGLYINRYYNTSGGIYGQIVKLYNPNQVQITDSVKYSFENVVLTQDLDNQYSARITSNDVLDLVLDEDATYGVYVNGVPCKESTVTEDYIISKYEYVFYDDDFSILKQDTLTFKFAFYSNSTLLIISTNGGADAVKYWNYYFNKNLFEVTIDNKGFDYSAIDTIAPANPIYNRPVTISGIEGEDFKFTVTVDGQTYKDVESWTGLVDRKSKLTISNFPKILARYVDIDGTTNCVKTDILGCDVINCKDISNSDTVYVFTNFNSMENNAIAFSTYVNSINTYSVTFDANGGSGTMASQSGFKFGFSKQLSSNAFTREGYTFCGWALTPTGEVKYYDNQSVKDIYILEQNGVTLYAVWKTNVAKVTITVYYKTSGNYSLISEFSYYAEVGKSTIFKDVLMSYNQSLADATLYSYDYSMVNGEKVETFMVTGVVEASCYFTIVLHTLTLTSDKILFEETEGWTLSEDCKSISKKFYSGSTIMATNIVNMADDYYVCGFIDCEEGVRIYMPKYDVTYAISYAKKTISTLTLTCVQQFKEAEGWTLSEDKRTATKQVKEFDKIKISTINLIPDGYRLLYLEKAGDFERVIDTIEVYSVDLTFTVVVEEIQVFVGTFKCQEFYKK